MEFGIQFFPDVGPGEKSAAQFWADALHLVSLCDPLGYTSVRTVEHYFHRYGGYPSCFYPPPPCVPKRLGC